MLQKEFEKMEIYAKTKEVARPKMSLRGVEMHFEQLHDQAT